MLYSRGLPWPVGPSALFLAPCCPCARREAEVLVLRAPGAARTEHPVRTLQPQLGSSCALRSLGRSHTAAAPAVPTRWSPRDCLGGAMLGPPGSPGRESESREPVR